MDAAVPPDKPQKKLLIVCEIITILNIYSFMIYTFSFAVYPLIETFDMTFVLIFIFAFPIYIGWFMPPFLLVLSALYAIIRRKLYPRSLIPLASFVCLALLFCILSFTSDRIYSAAAKARLRKDGTAVVSMIQTGQLRPDEYDRVYLPAEYRRLSSRDYVVAEYTQDGSLYVLVDYTFGILADSSGFLYFEGDSDTAANIAASYRHDLTGTIIPYWYSIRETNFRHLYS